tara:strand:- start:522 stop:1148 length:627 start_codon:yes stop_codon:yes gene_type:complete
MRVVKNELLNLNDFVFVKENAFTDEFCDSLIENFESLKTQGLTRQGQSGIGVNNDVKSTTDLDMFQFPDLMETYIQEASQIFNETLSESFLGKLPYQKEFGKDELFHNTTFYELMQIQKYNKNKGHYNGWHAETGNFEMSRRMFVFILYLNDVKKGGETEMLYTGLKVSPKKGQLLIHPASFPFVHKGHTPTSDDKYILTTWLSYVPE